MSAEPFWLFRRRGSSRWVFVWQPDPTKKSKRRQVHLPENLKTEAEARRYAELHADEIKGAKPRPRARNITVADLAERWVKLRRVDKRYAAATFGDAVCQLRKWIVPALGEKSVSSLDVPCVRAWVRTLSKATGRNGKPLAPYTIRNILRALKWFLSDVIGEGWATIPGGNPAKDESVQSELPEMAPLAGRSQLLRVKDTADAQRLIDCPAVPVQRRVRYLLDLTTGLRDGELAGLTWGDLDLDRGVCHVRRALQQRTREGGAGIGRTKTRASVRAVPLHPAAVKALKEWLDEGWVFHVGRAPKDTDPVFCTRDGKAHRPRSAFQFRDDAGAAGIATHVQGHALTFHALRRSFIQWVRAAGAPEEDRRALLGHAGKGAEECHYSEVEIGTLAGWVNKIGLRWGAAPAMA